jgi:hypothetical protein
MTTTLPSNVTALPATQDAPQISDRMAAFIAEELLPLMAGCWPASANQLDANARGVALAWGGVLRGFTPAQIREVRAEILRRLPAAAVPVASPRLAISIRACEMEATVTVLQRDGVVTDGAVQVELERILNERRQRGYTITGRI